MADSAAPVALNESMLAERLAAALDLIDDPAVVFDPSTPNLNAWPAPGVRREFAEWLAARCISPVGNVA